MPSVPESTSGAPSPPSAPHVPPGHFGPNAWLVEDLYERYLADPSSVAESWREFFSDYQRVQRPAPAQPVATHADATAVDGAEGAVALRGASKLIASNMAASLSIPTATSVRTIPARLLEINRAMINEYLSRTTGAKVSFTHVIAFAVLRALEAVPALNSTFLDAIDEKGTPGVVHHEHVGLGLAVDVERADGSRTLMVPVIRHADMLDFGAFVLAYEDLVRRVHAGTAKADDLAGATVSLTNPGTLGTVQSVPRLMPGQGAIIGVGALGWPAGFEAADPDALASLGVGKVVTLTSTYDHRIIQGAQSGMFLRHVEQCLTGSHDFYDELFSDLGVPYEPARWSSDHVAAEVSDEALREVHVQELINMYRVRGHLNAHLDPLDAEPPALHPELDIATYGLSIWDLGRTFLTDGLAGRSRATLQEILTVLRDAYCRTLGIEYMHIQDPVQKRWVQSRVEGVSTAVSVDEQRRLLDQLNAAEVFERFLHTRYVGQKRFGLEGAESTIVALDALFDAAADRGVTDAVIGMAHRGRLNVLANVVGKSYSEIFGEFEGNQDPDSVQGTGDVKYHKGASGIFKSASGATLRLTMASNPSHLEAVDPVVEGIARAMQDRVIAPSTGEAPISALPSHPVLAVLLHGDAAFAGQGVVAETLNLSGLSGYRTGGAVHLVINNQLGFTTSPQDARTSFYPTDVAKMIQAPIVHVNGDDPEACARAMRLAFEFREAFSSDVVVDLVCYRRHGHNEGDDPSYTQPLMYRAIETKRSVRKLYTEALIRRGDLTLEEAERALDDFQGKLQAVLDEVRERPVPVLTSLPAPAMPPPPASTSPRCAASPPPRRRCPRASRRTRSSSASSPHARSRWRRARSTGHSPRRSPSGHCCWRAPTCGSSARTPSAGPSRSATPRSSTTRPGARTCRCATLTAPRATSRFATRCSASTRHSASSTATRWSAPTHWSPGRRSSATSRTAPRSSSTTSWWRPRTSGASSRASRCSSPTATRARDRSTRAAASSASCRCARATTCASRCPRRPRSTSTSCAPKSAALGPPRSSASRRSHSFARA
jgi:multifunctional 2-oxoglutarate metabolism enzyme